MKRSLLSFSDGFSGKTPSPRGRLKTFDWDLAAKHIREHLLTHPDLKAEAGLQDDWEYTGGVIFDNGQPVTDSYTELSSNWATPTLILSWDGEEQIELDCYTTDPTTRFSSDSKWDEISLAVLNGEKILLLVQDECAPDAHEYFVKAMETKYNLTLEMFYTFGTKTKFGWKYEDYCLEYYPDAPQYHLFRLRGI